MPDVTIVQHTDIPGDTSTSATYEDVLNAILSAASFTANKRYLLKVAATVSISTSVQNVVLRLVTGTTPTLVPGSEHDNECQINNDGYSYNWLYEFTQPSTTEDIKLQVKTTGSTATVRCHSSPLFVAARPSSSSRDPRSGPTPRWSVRRERPRSC